MRQATCEQQAAALESREASRWQQASTGRAAVHDAAAANINCQLTGTQLFQASENVNHLFEFKKGCFEFRKGGGVRAADSTASDTTSKRRQLPGDRSSTRLRLYSTSKPVLSHSISSIQHSLRHADGCNNKPVL